jgi:hypothetical protein
MRFWPSTGQLKVGRSVADDRAAMAVAEAAAEAAVESVQLLYSAQPIAILFRSTTVCHALSQLLIQPPTFLLSLAVLMFSTEDEIRWTQMLTMMRKKVHSTQIKDKFVNESV